MLERIISLKIDPYKQLGRRKGLWVPQPLWHVESLFQADHQDSLHHFFRQLTMVQVYS